MKYILIISLSWLCSCGPAKVSDPAIDPLTSGDIRKAWVVDIVVGDQYILCPNLPPEYEDPFNPTKPAHVVVLARKEGWVKYCWIQDLHETLRPEFTRTDAEFIALVKACYN